LRKELEGEKYTQLNEKKEKREMNCYSVKENCRQREKERE
jgi:hypothetical protein